MPRLKYASILRILVILALFCVWVQIMLSASNGVLDKDGGSNSTWNLNTSLINKERDIKDSNATWMAVTEQLMNSNDTSEQVLALVPPELHKYLTVHPRNFSANVTEKYGPKDVSDILRAITRANEAQVIYNEDTFGPVQNDTIIIAIQVHTRLTYLRHLIVSLAQAQDIDKALLIFSHDYYDEEINNLVRTIDFTKVMQIFYPYSIQTHQSEFPGIDPNDCPRDAKMEQAIKLKCNNALHPDLHGHYREAKYTQTKHHWWWKANRIFNQLQCTNGHTGMVVFLEEDHYVAEDLIHVLHLLRSTADKTCAQCEILCLGTYLKTYQYHSNSDKVEITPWHSSMHNMGMVFNRTVWESIMELEEQFCAYDDYNWDYSLLHLSQNRPGREKFKVILCKGPRVFHIGECGFHHKKSNCNASTVISKVQKLLKDAKSYLYPYKVTATISAGGAKHNKKLVKGNGGWGDLRDQELCTNMTKLGRPRRSIYYSAIKLKCNNALHPDLHGHYREAKYTQTKHHWWWKANRIFNQLQCTNGHTGMVVFLEEDHYVAEDLIHVLHLLRSTADKTCAQCEILCLGTYLKTYQYHSNSDKVEITPWHSSMHNMGMVFNRTVWESIMELEEQFCAYDDYNWDYSLLHLSQNRPGREKFKVILCKGPRVFHIGECGFHHKKSNCNASTVISKVQKLLKDAKSYLYPYKVTATISAGGAKHNKKLVKGNGGWGDLRDQELCTNMTKLGRPRRSIYYS